MQINIADMAQMNERKEKEKEFYDAILDPYEHPWLVTDEASLYDITLDDNNNLIQRIDAHYGIHIDIQHLSMPFWKLLDYLDENRK